jgi:hypothetical protein
MAVNKPGSRKKFEWGIGDEGCSFFERTLGPDTFYEASRSTECMNKRFTANQAPPSIRGGRAKRALDTHEEMMSSFRYDKREICVGLTESPSCLKKHQRTVGVETDDIMWPGGDQLHKITWGVGEASDPTSHSNSFSSISASQDRLDDFSSPIDVFDSADLFSSATPDDWLMPGLHCSGSFNGLFFIN